VNLRLLAVMLATVAWVTAPIGAQLHHLRVAHDVCDEHGEVVEVHDDGHDAFALHAHDGPAMTAGDADEHDHGCSMPVPARMSCTSPGRITEPWPSLSWCSSAPCST